MSANAQHLQQMLTLLHRLIEDSMQRAQQAGRNPNDTLRGLIIMPDEVLADMQQPPLVDLWTGRGELNWDVFAPQAESGSRLWFLAQIYDLTALDVAILLIGLAPALDARYEQMYAFLQDNVTQKQPTISLAMNLLGGNVAQRLAVRERLQHHMPLQEQRLITILPNPSQPQAPLLHHIISCDERLIAFLLGDDTPDHLLQDAMQILNPADSPPTSNNTPITAEQLLEAPLIAMMGPEDSGQRETAHTLCQQTNLPLLVIDAARLPAEVDWALILREGYLHGAVLFIDAWDSQLDKVDQPNALVWARIINYPYAVFLSGQKDWEPQGSSLNHAPRRPMLRLSFDDLDYQQRFALWQNALTRHDVHLPDDVISALANRYRFTGRQIASAVSGALDRARTARTAPDAETFFKGAQAQVSLRIDRMAKRIEPHVDWNDLILPPEQYQQLQEIVSRAAHTYIVQFEWGFGERFKNLAGISALFSGESGTGKTLAAQVIARELDLPLYKIDLSGVVSKYIGETEKNLHTIFEEARSSSAILFFDEADALFGKRSEVKDAHDRYANIEVAYLLQKIEEYDGIAIMATNLRQNLDEAFTRRLDFLIDFPFPDAEHRHKIWQVHFHAKAPLDRRINLDKLAEDYHLSGGNIRNAAIASAYLAAADDGRVITMRHLQQAIRREYQKMGRLLHNK